MDSFGELRGLTRRAWLVSAAARLSVTAGLVTQIPRLAEAKATITVYKDPSCRCCTQWVEHLRAHGLSPVARDRNDMDALKDSLGIPTALRACHTAVAGVYVIEGHVPAPDITRLLSQRPKDVAGLAVPGMPMGSPGMEAGSRIDRFDVLSFTAAGITRVFARHG